MDDDPLTPSTPANATVIAAPTLLEYLQQHWGYLVLIVILIGISAIVSGYEAAFFSFKPDEDEDQRAIEPYFMRILRFFQLRTRQFIATILISNNFVNVAIVMIAALLLDGLKKVQGFEGVPALVWSLFDLIVITSVLLLFGEITPKIYASYFQVRFLRLFTPVLRLFYTLFYPFSWVLSQVSALIFSPAPHKKSRVDLNDLKHAIDLTPDIESPPEEKQILRALVGLGGIPVRSVMCARVDIKALDYNLNTADALAQIRKFGYSRIPVFKDNIDTIIGVVHIKDLLPLVPQAHNGKEWHQFIRPAQFVPENKKINKLLNEFKEKKLHIAVVVDEFGGTAGIVTLQDILDEIFGQIFVDYAKTELPFSKISDTEFIFDGKMPLLDVCRIAGIEEDEFDDVKGENDSLGGLILEMHGKFPSKGEVIHYKQYRFAIESVTARVIKRVKFSILPAKAEDDD